MDWWAWLIVIVLLLAVGFGGFLALQVKRRSGGVIAASKRSRGGTS